MRDIGQHFFLLAPLPPNVYTPEYKADITKVFVFEAPSVNNQNAWKQYFLSSLSNKSIYR
jgi:hypothetical protein